MSASDRHRLVVGGLNRRNMRYGKCKNILMQQQDSDVKIALTLPIDVSFAYLPSLFDFLAFAPASLES